MGRLRPVTKLFSDGLAIEVFMTLPFGETANAVYNTLSPNGSHTADNSVDARLPRSVVTTFVSSTIIRSFAFVLSATNTLVPSGENATDCG
jgi:hypothetical protein